MSKRPTHVYEIPCMRCDYQSSCDKYVKIDPRMTTQRDKMWNDADLNCMDCILRNVLKMRKDGANAS
nr:MAG TPA: hypothetical protein [Caudoviricetes sp.]